ncbi:MAG: NlpC/P60 family protein [Firmicutes bacterium]|nr:NlpC/P60 family protein [Bacillota bacterium]
MEKKISMVVDELLGIPYLHNGRSDQGLDCWGLIYLFFKKLGHTLPINDGEIIPDNWYKVDPERYINGLRSLGDELGYYENLQMLDIPYFRLYRQVVTHTAVMISEHEFLHVLIDKEVQIDTMKKRYWRRKYAGAIRLDI